MGWKKVSSHYHLWATEELSLGETGLAGDQKQNRPIPGSVLLLAPLMNGIGPGRDPNCGPK